MKLRNERKKDKTPHLLCIYHRHQEKRKGINEREERKKKKEEKEYEEKKVEQQLNISEVKLKRSGRLKIQV